MKQASSQIADRHEEATRVFDKVLKQIYNTNSTYYIYNCLTKVHNIPSRPRIATTLTIQANTKGGPHRVRDEMWLGIYMDISRIITWTDARGCEGRKESRVKVHYSY